MYLFFTIIVLKTKNLYLQKYFQRNVFIFCMTYFKIKLLQQYLILFIKLKHNAW